MQLHVSDGASKHIILLDVPLTPVAVMRGICLQKAYTRRAKVRLTRTFRSSRKIFRHGNAFSRECTTLYRRQSPSNGCTLLEYSTMQMWKNAIYRRLFRREFRRTKILLFRKLHSRDTFNLNTHCQYLSWIIVCTWYINILYYKLKQSLYCTIYILFYILYIILHCTFYTVNIKIYSRKI